MKLPLKSLPPWACDNESSAPDIETDVDPLEPDDVDAEADKAEQEAHAEQDADLFTPMSDVIASVKRKVQSGEGDSLLPCGFDGFELSAERITMIGAPPGTGKTALAMQIAYTVAENAPELPVVIANAEMSGEVLVKRELARRSEVFFNRIRFADFLEGQAEQVAAAADELEAVTRNVRILKQENCNVLSLLSLRKESKPGLLVVDYLQMFRDMSEDTTKALEQAMRDFRSIAAAGWAVLVISSLNRGSARNGSYQSSEIGMASYRGSGEIEFQANTGYTLAEAAEDAKNPEPLQTTSTEKRMLLKCNKNRDGDTQSFDLIFCPSLMRFTPPEPQPHDFGDYGGGKYPYE